MSRPAARLGDRATGMDRHIVLVPTPAGPTPTLLPFPFSGTLTGGCCATVLIGGRPAAVVGSKAVNLPPHLPPTPPGGAFLRPPDNTGTVTSGSALVLIGGKPAARSGDTVTTCSDPVPGPNARLTSFCTVLIG
ncbi:PAAR domain-containing protein [Streptomyces sp. NPDC059104]|uniref:PAAR domain-containing protein n=1 Tax=Streptomyces sp. NPDC059104 TaxID=3346729 RepID=UPI003679939A